MIGGGLPEEARGSQAQAEQSQAARASQPADSKCNRKGLERGAVRQREHSETAVLTKAQFLQLINNICSHFGPSLL